MVICARDKLELLNDQSAVEWNDLRAVLKPIERGFFGVVFLSTGTVVVRGFQRGRILRPVAANRDRVERDFCVGVFLELFEVVE